MPSRLIVQRLSRNGRDIAGAIRIWLATDISCCTAKAGPPRRAGLSNDTYKGWLYRNDCVVVATLPEHLTLIPAPARLRRFLATPLHEIIMHKI
jgi:hypothetical protein